MPRKRRRNGLNPAVITGLVIVGAVVLAFAGFSGGLLKIQSMPGMAALPAMPVPAAEPVVMQPPPVLQQPPVQVAQPIAQAPVNVAPIPVKVAAPTPTPTPIMLKPAFPVLATPTPTPFVGTPPCNGKISFFSRLLRAAVGGTNPCPTTSSTQVMPPVVINQALPTPTPTSTPTTPVVSPQGSPVPPITGGCPTLSFFGRLSRSLRAAVGAAPAPCPPLVEIPPAVGDELVARDDLFENICNNQVLNVAVPGLKWNDTVPAALAPAQSIRVFAPLPPGVVIAGLTMSINEDGAFTYQPPAGFVGEVTFQYRLRKYEGALPVGLYSNEATVTLRVIACPGGVPPGPPGQNPWVPGPPVTFSGSWYCVNRWYDQFPFRSVWTKPATAPDAGRPFCTRDVICRATATEGVAGGGHKVQCGANAVNPIAPADFQPAGTALAFSVWDDQYFFEYGRLFTGSNEAGYDTYQACRSDCRSAVTSYLSNDFYPKRANKLYQAWQAGQFSWLTYTNNIFQLQYFTKFKLWPPAWWGI